MTLAEMVAQLTEQRAREGLDAPLEKSWCESIVSVSGE